MIDLRSDTVTRPSDEMREAAATADVGDDVYGEDPTVNELERTAAEVVGTEDALFVPSGSMGNQVALRAHADRGTELVCDAESHLFRWELAGTAQLAGVQTHPVDFDGGAPDPADVADAVHEPDSHAPGTGLLALENTHNARGGLAVPVDDVAAAADVARDAGVPVHLDGARLFNAAVALDVDPAELVDPVDSVMFCLSKGLGAPVGSMVAGSETFVAAARRARKLYGGGMRQVGVVAGPGLLALENRHRLGTDHDNAALLADRLADVPGLRVQSPETNVVVVDAREAGLTAEQFVAACEREGVRAGTFGEYRARLCTHLDVDEADVREAADCVEAALSAVEDGDTVDVVGAAGDAERTGY